MKDLAAPRAAFLQRADGGHVGQCLADPHILVARAAWNGLEQVHRTDDLAAQPYRQGMHRGKARLPGGGGLRPALPDGGQVERPVLSVAEVYCLADAIEPRYRALILLATFGNLRRGELAGPRRRNLALGHRVARVVKTVYELDRLVKGTPKSEASARKITLPEMVIPELRRHLGAFTPAGPDAFEFVHVQGGQSRRSNFSKPWARAQGEADLPSTVHVHDLRHTGNTLAAEAGASLAELMTRMGHSSTRAAKVYLHAREERDRQLADVLDRMARRELRRSGTARNVNASGTYRARRRSGRRERDTDDHG